MSGVKKSNKIYSFLILVLFLSLSLSLISFKAYADEKVYSIDKITINVQVNDSGDLNVEEKYDYNFQGDFNGIRRSINTEKSQGIKNITVGEILKTSEDKLIPFKNNTSGEEGTYEVTKEDAMEKIKIFSKTSNVVKSFYIKYTILGAATKYNDIGEVYWKFYENTADVNISNIEVKVNFLNAKFNESSQGESSNEVKFWGIGPSSGNSEKLDDSTFRFNIDTLNSNEFIGCRIMFPAEYLKSARNIISEDAYDRIINEQLEQSTEGQDTPSNEAEGEQSQPPIYENNNPPSSEYNNNISYSGDFGNENNIGGTVIFVLVVGGIVGIIFLSVRKREEFNKALDEYRNTYTFFNEKYCNKFPSGLSPALVSLLVNRNVEIKDVMATLINLSTRGLLKCETHKYVKTHFIASDEEKVDYEFIIVENKLSELSPHERHLINWLATYGFNNSFRLSQIEAQAQDRVSARKFQTNYDIWASLVKEEAENLGFYVKIKNKTKLSNEFYNEYLMWEGFKKYLQEYDNVNTSNLVEEDFWDKVTAYAISLDLTDSIIKFSPNYREDTYHSNNYNHHNNIPFYNIMYINDFCHDFNSSLYRHTHDDNNNNSGSSGFSGGDGGSFTGGGDSFGGGGGGGSDAF